MHPKTPMTPGAFIPVEQMYLNTQDAPKTPQGQS